MKNKPEVCDTIRLLVHMAANIRKLSGLYTEYPGKMIDLSMQIGEV